MGYKAYDWLDLAFFYNLTRSKSDAGKYSEEHRLIFDGILKWKAMGLSFADTNRMELRYFDVRERPRYRNEFKISKSIEFMGTELIPYVSEEIWWDLSGHREHLNYFTVGCSKRINKNLKVNLFYRLISKKTGDDWSEENYIGTGMAIQF